MTQEITLQRSALPRRARRRQDEAARWYVLFQERELTPRDIKAWNRWEADAENRQAFDAIERVWEALSQIGSPSPSSSEVHRRLDNDVRLAPLRPDERKSQRQGVARWLFVLASTTGVLAATFAMALIGLRWAAPTQWNSIMTGGRMSVIETGVAEHRDIVLSDGSKIALGARTVISADISDHARTIVLSRGEALFQVKRDPARPFQVIAGGGTITAVGTAFNVRRREDDAVIVTVTEGTVEVAPRFPHAADGHGGVQTGNAKAPVVAQKVTHGHEISYDPQGRLSESRAINEEFSATWRSGHLRYQSEPLRNVLPDVNRYSRRPLILGDKAAGELLYSGTVFESDVDEWIGGLDKLYPELQVTVTDTDHVLVRSRATAP